MRFTYYKDLSPVTKANETRVFCVCILKINGGRWLKLYCLVRFGHCKISEPYHLCKKDPKLVTIQYWCTIFCVHPQPL